MGRIQSRTMERNPQNDTIILETVMNQMGAEGAYKQFPIKTRPVILERSESKSVKAIENRNF